MKIIRTAILSLALAFGAEAVVAQDFDKGLPVYNSGDYEIAFLKGCAG